MRLRGGVLAFLGIILCAVGPGFARVPGADEQSASGGSSDVVSTTSLESGAAAASAPAPVPAPTPAPASNSEKEQPPLAPAVATSGSLGLFTQETADLLPKGGWTLSAFGNKFTRMPGSITVLQYGLDAGFGITNWLNVSVAFDPDEYMVVHGPDQLSLASAQLNPLYPNSIYGVLTGSPRPGYVEDFPFASHDDGGVGPVVLGIKIGLLSEKRGAPISLSVRDQLYIPTVTSLSGLMSNQVQNGKFDDQLMLAASKNWHDDFVMTTNFGVMFVPDMSFNTSSGEVQALNQAQQVILGVGFLSFPKKRIQLMSEYNAVIFTSSHTPNDSFGPRDPVDGIWGVRFYPFRKLYIDAGYRYMLNLSHAQDRNGFVIKVGTGVSPYKAPPPVNYSPVAACSADKSSVFAGSNDTVNVSTTATDPDGDPMTYSWTATGGSVNGTGPQVRWLSAGTTPGTYTVTVTVNDGRGGSATCSVNTTVAVRPNRPPTVTLSSDRDTVFIGERVQFTAVGADPDNDPLTYTWRTNCGQLSGTGTTDTLDTTGVPAGTCTVTVRADDGRGGAADASKGVNVQAPPPPPQASKMDSCDFKPASSARVDNVCKRILDNVGLRLQNEPKGTVVVVGYSDPKPAARAAKLAKDRGDNTAKYLAGKGVDASRITTRTGAGQAGAKDNSRIDIIWVPEGATY